MFTKETAKELVIILGSPDYVVGYGIFGDVFGFGTATFFCDYLTNTTNTSLSAFNMCDLTRKMLPRCAFISRLG
jgi:hypothetical protein